MLKQINIELISSIRKPVKGNRIWHGVITVLIFILFPVILIVGIAIMLTIGVFSFFQGLFVKLKVKKPQSNKAIKPLQINQWNLFVNLNQLKIYEKYNGEVRFGPAYLNLKSEPKIDYLNGKLFGDWFFLHPDGVLLQQWNSTKNPNTNLIFIGIENREVHVLKKNIPSVNWKIADMKGKTLELNCDTGTGILTYKIDLEIK